MKCESCGNELVGGVVICRVCNHNNALRGVNPTISRRTDEAQESPPRRADDAQPTSSRTTARLTELPTIVPRKDSDANLIRFPATSKKQLAGKQPVNARTAPEPQAWADDESDLSTYPPWRQQLKEKVRQLREKRNSGPLAMDEPFADGPSEKPGEAGFDQNPIVESALKRIRWATHSPAIAPTVSTGRQGGRAAAVAKLTQPEPETGTRTGPRPQPRPEPRAELRPEPRPEPRPESRMFAPKPDQATRQADNQATGGIINRQPVTRAETRTLTPRANQPTGVKPEPKPSPSNESKILTPRARPQTTVESQTETRQARREPAAAAFEREAEPSPITAERHLETQVIEIAMAPEPMFSLETEPASLWMRTLAGACDFEIIATAFLPIFGSYATLNTTLGLESLILMLVLLSAITFVYQIVMLMIAGRTSGMALLNLNLFNTDDDSLSVSRRQKMLRAWAATIAFLFPPLNLLVTRLNTSQRSMPDLISGTTVAKQ